MNRQGGEPKEEERESPRDEGVPVEEAYSRMLRARGPGAKLMYGSEKRKISVRR